MEDRKVCTRCKGAGYGDPNVYRAMGHECFRCGGTGYLPTKEELAQREKVMTALKLVIAQFDVRSETRTVASQAFWHLQANAPERFTKLLASVGEGRVPEVAAALVDYGIEHKVYGA